MYSFYKKHAGYIQSCMRAGYIQSCMRAGYIQSCMRAGYIQSCMRAGFIQSCMRAGFIQSCMTARYIQSCMRTVAVLVPVAEVTLHIKKFCFIQPNSKLSSLSFVCFYLTAADFFKGDLNVIPAKTTANLQKGLF